MRYIRLRRLLLVSEITGKQIICGHKPHHQATGHPAMLRLHQGDFPAKPEVGFTDSLWRIIERCWHGQPEARPSAHAVMDVLDEALRG